MRLAFHTADTLPASAPERERAERINVRMSVGDKARTAKAIHAMRRAGLFSGPDTIGVQWMNAVSLMERVSSAFERGTDAERDAISRIIRKAE